MHLRKGGSENVHERKEPMNQEKFWNDRKAWICLCLATFILGIGVGGLAHMLKTSKVERTDKQSMKHSAPGISWIIPEDASLVSYSTLQVVDANETNGVALVMVGDSGYGFQTKNPVIMTLKPRTRFRYCIYQPLDGSNAFSDEDFYAPWNRNKEVLILHGKDRKIQVIEVPQPPEDPGRPHPQGPR
jgi:hypothetical protein